MTVTHNSNEQIIGRDQINDIEAILSVRNTDPNAKSHSVQGGGETIFTWDYTLARPPLRKLYEKAKTGQWNGELDLPWETEVDIERTIAADQAAIGAGIDPAFYSGTPLAKWGDKEWLEFGIEGRRWMLSQFLEYAQVHKCLDGGEFWETRPKNVYSLNRLECLKAVF